MRRYVFVNRYFYPDTCATSQLLSDLAFAAAASGERVLVVTSRDSYCGHAAALPARATIDGVDIVRVWTTRFGRKRLLGRALDYVSFYVSALFALLRHVRRGDVVIAKTDPPLISVVVALCARVRGAAHVNWLQDLFPEVGTQLRVPGMRLLETLLVALRDFSLRQARMNIVLGERMREVLLARGIPAQRVRVISNWAEACIAPLPRSDNRLRQDWGFADRHFVVGYSGNMGRAHAIETIIAAAIRLRTHPRIRFLFVGNGAKRELVEQAKATNCLGNVCLQDYQRKESLATSLAVPDVHLVSLLPGLEGLIVPCKVYGALAAGRAIVNVGDAQGEVARLLNDSAAGVTCAVGDVDALCVTLERMCESDECVRMGEAAHQYSAEFLHRDIAIQRWLRALSAVALEAEHGDGVLPNVAIAIGSPTQN